MKQIASATLSRYVDRNAVRANLFGRAEEEWRWRSLYQWMSQSESDPKLLSAWPLPRLPNWVRRVNEPLTNKEIAAVRLEFEAWKPFWKRYLGRINHASIWPGIELASTRTLPANQRLLTPLFFPDTFVFPEPRPLR